MKCFFTSTHFCPTYGEVILQCQNFAFIMHGSDYAKWEGSHEITMCIPFTYNFRLYWHPTIICVLCIDCILVLTSIIFLVYTSCHLYVVVFFSLPVLILQTCTQMAFHLAVTGYLLTYVSFILLCLVHLFVILSQIKVQQPVSENGNLAGVSSKEGNKWNGNAYHKCSRKKKQWRIWKSVHVIWQTVNGYVLGWHWG